MYDNKLETIRASAARARDILGGSGTCEAEIFHCETRDLAATACKGAIQEFTDSRSGAAAVRVAKELRMGGAFTERIDAASLEAALRLAAEAAGFMDADKGNVLETGSDNLLSGLDAPWDNDSLETGAKKRLALELEAACYARDKRVINVPGAGYGESDMIRIVANGRGMVKAERHRACHAIAYVMASDGGSTETGFHIQAFPSFKLLDPAAIAARAVESALEKLGAVEPESGNMRTVIQNDAASDLLGAFMSSLSAEAIQKGKSGLAGKRGSRVGSRLFEVLDDPTGPGLNHAAFDDEGIPSGKLEPFKEGVFLEPLYTVYSAAREGARPNGRGFRPSPTAGVSASLVNAILPAGTSSLADLLAGLGSGILITEVQGLHAGLNPVSGDFSCSARGFEVRGGKRGAALRNFTISGNFYRLIAGLEAKGSDLRDDVYGQFRSPSIAIAEISVSSS
jgi:PmbA protein